MSENLVVWLVCEEHEGATSIDAWVDSVWTSESLAEQRAAYIREQLPESQVDVMDYDLDVTDGSRLAGHSDQGWVV